jgi:hypothetical protein
LGLRVGATLTPYKQEFFGSFLQEKERLAFFCLTHRPGDSATSHSHRNLVLVVRRSADISVRRAADKDGPRLAIWQREAAMIQALEKQESGK